MKIVVTGITGLLGQALAKQLISEGHVVSGVSRKTQVLSQLPDVKICSWDELSHSEFVTQFFENVDAVIHLAGEPVADRRWTEKIKNNILSSRIESTEKIVKLIKSLPLNQRPKTFIGGSAIGYYGDCADLTITEKSSVGHDFLAEVVKLWEQQLIKPKDLGLRTVILRTGIVLSDKGGALPKIPPVVIGDGQNFMSWIHIQDWVQCVMFALNNSKVEGIFNLTAPNPVNQKEFVTELVKFKMIPLSLWSPKFLVKLGLGEMSEVILTSQKVMPENLNKLNFKFKYPELSKALKEIYQKH